MSSDPILIGVLALQGAFLEHIHQLNQLGVKTIEVRNIDELNSTDGLIIPGGESTSMSLIAERWNLLEPLKQYVQSNRVVFGTCAGMILLSDIVDNQKQTGQYNLGGLQCTIHRNFYPNGQLGSFSSQYESQVLAERYGGSTQVQAVFIRAPGITSVGDRCEVLCSVPVDDVHNIGAVDNPIAIRQNNILATTFHPVCIHIAVIYNKQYPDMILLVFK